jgi:hypothetical protein
VQLALFGRELHGQPDVLPGYALLPLRVSDPGVIATSGTEHHTTARHTGDPRNEIHGSVFAITAADLEAADAYEVDYERVTVRLQSGLEAWTYLAAAE